MTRQRSAVLALAILAGVGMTLAGPAVAQTSPGTPGMPPAPTATPVPGAGGGLVEVKQQPLSLQVGQEQIVSVAVMRVSTGNASVVKATPLSDGSGVLLTALSAGKTEVRLFPIDEPNVARVIEVTVKRRNLDDLKLEVEALLAEMVGIQVEKKGENLVLKGKVFERVDRDRLVIIKDLYPELIDFTIDEFKQVAENKLREDILRDLEEEKLTTIRVEIKNVRGEFKALLRGTAYTDRARARAEEIAKLYYENVVNLIQLEKPVIEIDVVVATLDMDKVKQLGTNNVFGQLTSFVFTGYTNSNFGRDSFWDDDDDNRAEGPVGENREDEPFQRSVGPTFSIASNVQDAIRALKQTDAALSYNEQHQAVVSGQEAEFKDGGTLFLAAETPLGGSSITEIEFGLQVNVTPEQRENNIIVNTIEVTNSNPVALDSSSGEASVALDELETSSVVECRSDETIVLSGSDSNNLVHSDKGTPFLRRVPIINLLFRERDKQGSESRTLILITPTASTIQRQERLAFSTDTMRKRDFIKQESPYWELDMDWGFCNEFYERPGEQIPYITSYNTTLYYDTVEAPSEAEMATMSGEESMMMESEPMEEAPADAAPMEEAPAEPAM